MFTVIPYFYCDASGYKAHGDVVLEGSLSSQEAAYIEKCLEDGEFFIPADLQGLSIVELQSKLSSFPSEADHVFHVLDVSQLSIEETCPVDATPIPVVKFVEAFRKVHADGGWQINAAHQRLGL